MPRPTVSVVIPVINEREAIPGLLAEMPWDLLDEVVVVDGGSDDGTPEAARAGGARVVVERRPGYGRACATGAESARGDVLVFLDGDGSDDPVYVGRLLAAVIDGGADLALGVRTQAERGAFRIHQELGNTLVRLVVRVRYRLALRDIPSMRAVRAGTLRSLGMQELTYGWPTEMVVRSAAAGLRIAQVDVRMRARRGGRSKVAGRLGPSLRAGGRMLCVALRSCRPSRPRHPGS